MDFTPPFNGTGDDLNTPSTDISPGLGVLLFVVLPVAAVLLIAGLAWAYLAWRSRRSRKRNENSTVRSTGKLARRADIALQERAVDDGRLGDTEGGPQEAGKRSRGLADARTLSAAFNLKLADLELGIDRTESSTGQVPPPYDPAIGGVARVG